MRIELQPVQPAAGYPWHAYFGCRFAWRDERAILMRGSGGTGHVTRTRARRRRTFSSCARGRWEPSSFPRGLPSINGKKAACSTSSFSPKAKRRRPSTWASPSIARRPCKRRFGLSSPVAVVPTNQGPPHVGTSGWLFHLDASNLLLTRLVPGTLEAGGAPSQSGRGDGAASGMCQPFGTGGIALRAQSRSGVILLDARGQFLLEAVADRGRGAARSVA